jgi:hypothetical protein
MSSQSLTLEAVTRRLEELERAHHRLKRGFGAMVIGATGLLLMGQASERLTTDTLIARNIETQSLMVRDATGKIRALLEVDTAGPVSLTLSDREGRERASIGVGVAGSVGAVFRDQEGAIRAALGVSPRGRPFHVPKNGPGGEDNGVPRKD